MAEKQLRHTAAQIDAAIDKTRENEINISQLSKLHQEVNEDGFFVADTQKRVGMKYTPQEGLDAAKVSDHLMQMIVDAVKAQIDVNFNLTELESGLLNDAIAKIKSVNPDGRYMSFGVISDLHQVKEGGFYTGNGNAISADAEPSVKLLGAIALKAKLDAIFCLGDISAGLRDDCSYDEYVNVMEMVRKMFKKYMYVPVYVTMGNHDAHPSTNDYMSNAKWLEYSKSFNSQCEYFESRPDFINTSFFVDFPQKKFRMILPNSYLKSENAAYNSTDIFNALNFEGADEYTVCMASHDGRTGCMEDGRFSRAFLSGEDLGKGAGTGQVDFPVFNNGKLGKAHVGWIGGHLHRSTRSTRTEGNYIFNEIRVSNSYCEPNEKGTESAYCFSIFTIDTDQWKMYEHRIGRGGEIYEYNIAHN